LVLAAEFSTLQVDSGIDAAKLSFASEERAFHRLAGGDAVIRRDEGQGDSM
jgi:hypothetical protein